MDQAMTGAWETLAETRAVFVAWKQVTSDGCLLTNRTALCFRGRQNPFPFTDNCWHVKYNRFYTPRSHGM